ncbi:type IV secretion system protein B4 (plasmid) [Paracoccus versutus]|uniref:Type IV secretion system protein VirB4 n=1 Tax=Paracoccus versutus TaxID=34007 RepID=A0AAQ0HDP6_PARVE|nr:type IV secretion system protein B4 [Paracoccus versutus]REG28213.1 type IV secretion system protein VirB4 [Paracoccus versutus]WEJ80061.1 type IV secretion system protein B4 [Paracoccus versutus]
MFSPRDLSEVSERARTILPADLNLYRHMPYAIEVDDEVVRTRENGLLIALEITGIDGLTSSDSEIHELRRAFAHVLDGLDERFTVYIHRMMRPAQFGLKAIHGDGFAADLDRKWQAHLASKNLHDFVLVMTVVRNLSQPLKLPLFQRAAKRLLDGDTTTRLHELREVVSILETSLSLNARRLKISDGSMLGFLSAINTAVLGKSYRGRRTLIAEDVANIAVKFDHKRGTMLIEEGFGRPRYAATLAIWKYSETTWPGMLDALDTSIDMVICHSFTPIANHKISGRVKTRIDQMRAAGDLAASVAEQLLDVADDVETGKAGVGAHQLSITVYADSQAELDQRVSHIRGVSERMKVTLSRTERSLEATFFAQHPGNQDYQCWDMTVSTTTFADLASLHMENAGSPARKLPWQTPITVVETAGGCAHRFSWHEEGPPAPADPTLGHTLVLGPSNSGKSTTQAFLAAQAMRVPGLRIVLFDKDKALRPVVAALGGRYAQILAGRPTGLNPLLTESGPRGEAWQMDWLSALVERAGGHLTPQQSEALKSAVRQNGIAPAELRNFEKFQELIGDVNDDRDLALRLSEWGPRGRYGWVFGEAEEPVIDFSQKSRVLGIDLTEILDLPTERTAVLSFIFRRLELMFEDKVPTLVIIDEASTVLDDDYFARRIPKWLATVRKQNVVMILMTQFPSHIRESKAKSILEGLPNRMLFPNSKAVTKDYTGYNLTENELGFLLDGSRGKREVLFNGHSGSTVLNMDLSAVGPLLAALGSDEAARKMFGEDYETKPQFWRNFKHD